MNLSPSVQSVTQTIQHLLPKESVLRFHLDAQAPAAADLQPINIPKITRDLVGKIMGSDLFTSEQKTFASLWENHFNQLLTHTDPLVPARAVCFLGIEVLTPAIVLYKDNLLAKKQLIPVVGAHRYLLTVLLPPNSDVEGFVIQHEEIYNLMRETTMKLDAIMALSLETEQMICESATTMRDKILRNGNQSREMLRELAQQWKSKIDVINAKLTELTKQADVLNKKLQNHPHALASVGTQLAEEQRVFQGVVDGLKKQLMKV